MKTALPAQASSLMDRIKNNEPVLVGIHNAAPWGVVGLDGSATGVYPDLLRAVFERIGSANLKFSIVEWPSLIPSLVSRRIDFIATGMAITPARCQVVSFGEPDLAIGDALAVLRGNPKNIHSYADIRNNESLKVGGSRGSTNVENAAKAGIPKDRIMLFEGKDNMIAALFGGRIDAIAWSVPTAVNLLNDPNLKGKAERALPFEGIMNNGHPSAFYPAVAFRPEDKDVRDAYNIGLAALKKRAELKSIFDKYEFTAAEIVPAEITAKTLCGDSYQ